MFAGPRSTLTSAVMIHRKFWRAAVVASVTALAGLVAVPAHAATNNIWLPTQHDWQWDYGREWFAVETGPMSAGDCQESNGFVTLAPPDAQGNTSVAWGAGALLTHHTITADVWHQSFQFLTQYGTVALTAGGFDGPRMSKTNTEYSKYVVRYFKIDPQLWPLITTVRWTGDC